MSGSEREPANDVDHGTAPVPDGSITIEYDATWKDYRESQRMLSSPMWPPPKRQSKAQLLLGWVLFLGFIAGWIWLEGGIDAPIRILKYYPTITAVIVTLTLVVLFAWLLVIRMIRRQLAERRSTITFGNSGIDEKHNAGSTHTDWSHFAGWIESNDGFLLLLHESKNTRHTGIYFPKRLFNSAREMDRARQLFAAQINDCRPNTVDGDLSGK